MTKFIELTHGTTERKILFNIATICNVVIRSEDYACTGITQISTLEGDYFNVKETYEEVKALIVEAQNKQNSIANAILEVDQTLYRRLR